jgi:hypothetical protein
VCNSVVSHALDGTMVIFFFFLVAQNRVGTPKLHHPASQEERRRRKRKKIEAFSVCWSNWNFCRERKKKVSDEK